LDAAWGMASAMMEKSIEKLGGALKTQINKPHTTYMQNTNTKSVAPLVVDFKDATRVVTNNEITMNAVSKSAEHVADFAKDVYNNSNEK
jgi:hypothetical protein